MQAEANLKVLEQGIVPAWACALLSFIRKGYEPAVIYR